ncbi:MAG: PKD domain-containing protein [Candidatus Eisenbacteria bacterium]|nr:PKD domain-containing protein [Candidatus Eisenbacteria bacterium]
MRGFNKCLIASLALVAWVGAAEGQSLCGSWNAVSMPAAAGHGLAAVSASSATDAWAVWRGLYHWDGTDWSLVSAPGLGTQDTVFQAVAAVIPTTAWIVGTATRYGNTQTLFERWNGSAWLVVPSPVVTGGSGFDAVTALNANDAWAVGYRAGGLPEFQATTVTLTAHWDGTSWTRIPSPNISNRSHALMDVAAIASNDVWAVGYYRNMTENYQTLILHWNGSSWSITPSPNYPGLNHLYGVSATASNDVWAVGDAWDGVISRQIFLHWDGSTWSLITGPGGPTACVGCSGDVLAMGPDDVWAVGGTIGHWDGTEWTVVPNPDVPGSTGISMRALAKIGACDAWTVGSSFGADGSDNALAVRLSAGGGTANEIPIAMASADPGSGPGPLQVQFSSAGSHDPDGSIVSWLWNFGDSSYPANRTDPNPIHTYLQTGPLSYQVSLQVTDNDGAVTEASTQVLITPGTASVGPGAVADLLALRVSPNPSRGSSVITLTLPATGMVRVTILDVSGRKVRDVQSAVMEPGEHLLRWDGLDAEGRPAGDGMYFVTVTAGQSRVSTQLLRIR